MIYIHAHETKEALYIQVVPRVRANPGYTSSCDIVGLPQEDAVITGCILVLLILVVMFVSVLFTVCLLYCVTYVSRTHTHTVHVTSFCV